MSKFEDETKMSTVLGATFSTERIPIEAKRIVEMPKDLEKEYSKQRPDIAAIVMSRYGWWELFDAGDFNCKHSHVFYFDNGFDGQAMQCDDCSRYERLGYSHGLKIPFPANALVSTPNLDYGKENFYAFRTNDKGEVQELSREEWVPRLKK
jgi:hypothetical protein